jgi:hypothetical protein
MNRVTVRRLITIGPLQGHSVRSPLIDREMINRVQEYFSSDQGRPNIACPKCSFSPPPLAMWACYPDGCGGVFDTFETRGKTTRNDVAHTGITVSSDTAIAHARQCFALIGVIGKAQDSHTA